MSDFRENNDSNQSFYGNDENDIEVTASEEEIERMPYTDSTYHFSGDPYQSKRSRQSGREYSSDSYNNTENRSSSHHYNNIPKEPRRKKNTGLGMKIVRLAGAALIFGLVAGIGFNAVDIARDRLFPSKANKIETTTVKKSDSSGSTQSAAQAVADVVDGVMPSVVSITSKIQTSSYFGMGIQESEGAGSGFILAKTDEKLMIATNNHVVARANSLTVGFCDGTSAAATLVGNDTDADLAVIAVNIKDISDETISKIKIAVLGDSESLKVGEDVVAIGNALGYGQSVTTGVISAKNREVSFTDGTMTLLQTDAAINPGNSGGVLVNMNGEVVGINNAKLEDTSVEGMGYAIPISTAQVILTDIMNAKSVPEGQGAFLGIIGRTLDSQYSAALGMPSGIYVSQVVKGSPAEKAGIEAGDIITAFEGNNVSTMDGLKEKISLKEAGTKVKITLKRANQNGEYEEKTVSVTLGKESDYNTKTETDQSTQQPNTSTQQDYYEADPYSGGYDNFFYNFFR